MRPDRHRHGKRRAFPRIGFHVYGRANRLDAIAHNRQAKAETFHAKFCISLGMCPDKWGEYLLHLMWRHAEAIIANVKRACRVIQLHERDLDISL